MRSYVLVGGFAAWSALSIAGCAYPKHVEMVEVPNAVVPPHAVAAPASPTCTCVDEDKAEARAAAAEVVADIAQAVLTALLH